MEQAFANGLALVGVVYDLEYTGLTPGISVEITADFERIYDHFSAGFEAQVYGSNSDVDAAFEELEQNGAIKIRVIEFLGGGRTESKKWALSPSRTTCSRDGSNRPRSRQGARGAFSQPEGLDAVLEPGQDNSWPPAAGAGRITRGTQG